MSKEYRELLDELTKDAEGSSIYDLDYPSGLSDGIEMALKKYDELHKPVVIPQYVADWIESPDRDLTNVFVYEDPKEVHDWVFGDDGALRDDENIKLLFEAIANGYEVDQEKKYLVKVPHTTRDHYYKYPNGGVGTVMGNPAGRDEFVFTEEEINKLLPDVPVKYWEETK